MAEQTLQIQPYTATVNGLGQAIVEVGHSLHGIVWKVQQLGMALGQSAPSPQAAAHVNGIPLSGAVAMQPSVFASMTSQAPYAMESYFVGPPYIYLSAGDIITVGVIGAIAGDVFTVGAYLTEMVYDAGS